jgi:hypothetical protein
MTQPARPDEDDPSPPTAEAAPGALVWTIAGCTLILAYIAVVILLRPGG